MQDPSANLFGSRLGDRVADASPLDVDRANDPVPIIDDISKVSPSLTGYLIDIVAYYLLTTAYHVLTMQSLRKVAIFS